MAGKKNDFQAGFNSVKSGMGDKKSFDYPAPAPKPSSAAKVQNEDPSKPGFQPYTDPTGTNAQSFIDSMDRKQMKQGVVGSSYEGAAPLTRQQAADKRADLKKRAGRGEFTDDEYGQAIRVIRNRRIAGMGDRPVILAGPAYDKGKPPAPRFPNQARKK